MLNVNARYKKVLFPCSYFVYLMHLKPLHEKWARINTERGGLEISEWMSCCSLGKEVE